MANNAFLKFFKEPKAIEPLTDQQEIDRKYRQFRWRVFYSLYIGYAVSYIGRKNITVVLTNIENTFKISNVTLGFVLSAFYVAYGIGKFVNGILADKANVRTFFSTGLVMAAVCTLACSFIFTLSFISTTVLLLLLYFFWGATGWFHSMLFPPIAKSMSYWYTKKERGLKWSIISTSHQIGAASCLIITNAAISIFHDWKAAFYGPALITLLVGIWQFNRLRDKPESIGLPEIEKYKNDSDAPAEELREEKKEEQPKNKSSHMQVIIKNILLNPLVWILVISYLFVYVIKSASEDWMIKYFIQARGNFALNASFKTIFMQIVGAGGTIMAGVISDRFFKGKRAPVNIFFLLGLVFSLILLLIDPIKTTVLDYTYVALIGFFVSGLQNLVGLHIVEICCKEVASAANGFAGMVSYVGAIVASVGTGLALDLFGWSGAISFWIISTILAILLILSVIPLEKKLKKA